MIEPSARAKKRAEDVAFHCSHVTHAGELEVLVACTDCVARALDAEREVCAKLSEGLAMGEWSGTAAECSGECGDDIARAIRALAEEGA